MTDATADNTERHASHAPELRTPEQDLKTLISRVAQGDSQALGTLYDTTSALVHGLAVRILGNTALAEDVTLDVYTQVWRQAATYDVQRGAPAAWLFLLTRSRALDHLRAATQEQKRRATLAEAVDPIIPITPEESSIVAEQRRLVQTAFAALVPEQREVLELAYFAGLSSSAMATRLGVPLGTVKTRLRLGMVKLRELLQPLMLEEQ